MIFCLVCGVANRDGSRFCNACGRRVDGAVPCADCGAPNPLGSRFCSQCGVSLGPQPLAAPTPPAALAAPGDAAQSQSRDAENAPLQRRSGQPTFVGPRRPPGGEREAPQSASRQTETLWPSPAEDAAPHTVREQPHHAAGLAPPGEPVAPLVADQRRSAGWPGVSPGEQAPPAAFDEPSWAGTIAAAALLGADDVTWTDVTPRARPSVRSVAGVEALSAEDLSLFLPPPAAPPSPSVSQAPSAVGREAIGAGDLARARSWDERRGPTRAAAPLAARAPEAVALLRRIVGLDDGPTAAEQPRTPDAARPSS